MFWLSQLYLMLTDSLVYSVLLHQLYEPLETAYSKSTKSRSLSCSIKYTHWRTTHTYIHRLMVSCTVKGPKLHVMAYRNTYVWYLFISLLNSQHCRFKSIWHECFQVSFMICLVMFADFTLWLVLPSKLATGDKIKRTVTLNKITDFPEFEHCRKYLK